MRIEPRIVLLAVSILVMSGVIMIYSSSGIYAHMICGDSLYFVKRHIFFMLIGVIGAIVCMNIPVGFIRDHSRALMCFTVVLLILVLVPGIGALGGGARRWLRIAGFSIQPSEIAKLSIILYLADYTSRKRFYVAHLITGFTPAFIVICITAGLVLMEPDLGTAVSIGIIGILILFISGARLKHLVSIIVSSVPLLCVAVVSAPYRLKRVVTFLKPWEDPRGSGFQLIQSFIALGSGGITGVGLGGSRQKLFYLPQSHTDFIYSIIGEETGLIGATFVLFLFLVFVWSALSISFRIKDLFASRAAAGIALIIAFEAIVNIGVSTGSMPTKGLPLPFISYGGSSLVVHLIAIGILLNIARLME